jgi:hypothetical protein
MLALAWPALRAEDKNKEKPKSPAEQFRVLEKDFNDAQQDFFKAYQSAKSDDEREKLVKEKMPKAEKLAPRFLELAEKNPKDPAAVDALVWVVTHVQPQGDGKQPWSRALSTLARDHLESDKVARVCESMVYQPGAEADAFLRAQLAKNPSKQVQGRACLALAQQLKNSLTMRDQLAQLEGQFDKETISSLKKLDPAKVTKEIEALLDRAASEYADVKHPYSGLVGEKAKNELFELRFLSVGKVAPDVEGQDADGKKFSLHEYRGKVVLLDFWGNW